MFVVDSPLFVGVLRLGHRVVAEGERLSFFCLRGVRVAIVLLVRDDGTVVRARVEVFLSLLVVVVQVEVGACILPLIIVFIYFRV